MTSPSITDCSSSARITAPEMATSRPAASALFMIGNERLFLVSGRAGCHACGRNRVFVDPGERRAPRRLKALGPGRVAVVERQAPVGCPQDAAGVHRSDGHAHLVT